MILRERCKIAKLLCTELSTNIYKNFTYKLIDYHNLKTLCGIFIDTFNSSDSYQAYFIIEPLFIPLGFWDLSYGRYVNAYTKEDIVLSLKDMVKAYSYNIEPINNFEDIYNGLISQSIQNSGSEIYLLELLIYMSLELKHYREYLEYIKTFKKVSKELDAPWKDVIIQRVETIVKLYETGNLQLLHNTLLEWQNHTIKALKLPADLLVEVSDD